MKQIALLGKDRIAWCQLRSRAAQAVYRAVKKGFLVDLKEQIIPCKDCGSRAKVYDHRDYAKPLEVDPVCIGCNITRGTNAPRLNKDESKIECPDCESQYIRFRKTKRSFICCRCGNQWESLTTSNP